MERIVFGKLVNTHGLKGEVKIISDSDFKEERFKVGNTFYVGDLLLTIKTHRVHKNFDLVTFVGYTDINQVEKYKGMDVSIDADKIDKLEEDEFYYHELEGLSAYNEDELIGKVIEVRETPGNTLLVVKTDKKNIYIPYVDQFIKEVNLEEGKIYITPIEGLL